MSNTKRNTTSVTNVKQETSTDTSAKTPAENGGNYIDEYGKGIAYLNAIIENEKHNTFSIKMSTMQGSTKKMQYKHRRLTVASEKALSVLLQYQDDINNDDVKVVIHYNMVNPDVYPFMIKQGENAGKPAAIMTGFLSRIRYLKVDGVLVYQDHDEQENSMSATG